VTRVEPDGVPASRELVRSNPNAYGVYYTIDMGFAGPPFPEPGLYVAWAGDGDGSLRMTTRTRTRTRTPTPTGSRSATTSRPARLVFPGWFAYLGRNGFL
jgi:hypothetical protein